jgi:hypothetical protein
MEKEDCAMHGGKIYSVYPKRIYYVGMSLAGFVFSYYGLMTGLIFVMIPGLIILLFSLAGIFFRRIDFYDHRIVICSLGRSKELFADGIDRILWHIQKPMNMALAAQHKPAVKCTIVMKEGPEITLDAGLYRKLEERLKEYARTNGIESEQH